jgi:hypothetical protein
MAQSDGRQFDDQRSGDNRSPRAPSGSRSDNRLSIRSDGLSVELDGRAAQIRRAYHSLRTQIVEQFYETMSDARRPQDRTLKLPVSSVPGRAAPTAQSAPVVGGRNDSAKPARSKDEPAKRTAAPGENEAEAGQNFVNLVVCEESYHKMYLLDERRFKNSFLGAVLDVAPLGRVYVDGAVEKRLRDGLDVGATLWRELTPAGKAAMGRSD